MHRSRTSASRFISWKQRARTAFETFVRKNVPDPRDNPINEPVVDRNAFAQKQRGDNVEIGIAPGESIDDYMYNRDQQWMKDRVDEMKLHGAPVMEGKDGTESPFSPHPGHRDTYMTHESATKFFEERVPKKEDYKADDELKIIRRQLQVEEEEAYRKFIAEAKRNELNMKKSEKSKLQHPTDPSYDPFKKTPGYRPQDSTELANWLKRQRESGKAGSGLALNTKEGQERFYNEAKMATQYHANPFSNRIEEPRGLPVNQVTGYSPDSILINDVELIGSCIVTPTRYYHWNVSSFEELNERTLSLLLHLYPVPDVLFLGTGRNLYHLDEELNLHFQKRGISVVCMTTPNACQHFGQQLSLPRRLALAIINPIPTNPYGKECFGDFIENDQFSLSDTALGIPSHRQHNPMLGKTRNKVAEQYRDTQGTGIGPQYVEINGFVGKPGTHATKLRPAVEPGEEIEWEKLPSYFHWYPKESTEDYFENMTWREVGTKPVGDPGEKKLRKVMYKSAGDEPEERNALLELPPWDSRTIPVPKLPHEKMEKVAGINVVDPKTGRAVGMTREAYEKFKVMMKEREEGKEESDPVEFDQEQLVRDKDGRMYDLANLERFVPLSEARWHRRRGNKSNLPQMK